uniref:Uncharacterized protein n=1 Tax=Tetranychus urticae TaxID=32264 RepID=T1KT20_TETUR
MNSNTGYCMLLGISLLLTPEVHSDDWPKDRRFKNSRRASDDFELYRSQHNHHNHRGHHHQHHKLYSEGYTNLDTSNKTFIPGEEFLVTKSAHSSGLPTHLPLKVSHSSDQSKLSVKNISLTPSTLPTPSRLVNSGELNHLQSNDEAQKRTSSDASYEEDERRISFASRVTSNVHKGPSYESFSSPSSISSGSLSIGQGSKKGPISGYTFNGSKSGSSNSVKQHMKPAITKISLSLGVGNGGNSNNKNTNDNNNDNNNANTDEGLGVGSITFTNSGQSSDFFSNHNSNGKKSTIIGDGQSNEVKVNSLAAGSTGDSDDLYGSSSDKPNKASIMSSALNVIGGNDDNTQLAHSILLVQRPKNRPKPGNVYYWDNTMFTDNSESSASNSDSLPASVPSTTTTTTTTTTTSTTTVDPLSIISSSSETLYSNHRPAIKANKTRPWLRPTSTVKRKKPSNVSLVTSASSPDLSMMPRTTGQPFPFFDDEVPILMSNNHRKFPYTLTTRNKLSSDYASYWTTPSTTALYNDYSMFQKLPTKLPPNRRRSTTTTTTPSPAMIMGNKPPLKVTHVIASKNKEPDEVKSSILTVLDPHGGSAHLPPNTSIVHRNVLVPYRPGRPKPSPASTTQYPIYPILAGITNWPIQNNYSNNINNNNNLNDMTVSWQWDDADTYSGTTVAPFTAGNDPTSKSPIEFLDPIPVSSINRPTIAIIGSRPGGFGSFRPTPTTIITSSPSHVISVTPIGSNTGHVISSSPNTSTGQKQQHIFGEVIHSPRPPSGTSASHQSDVNLSSSAAAAAASTSSSLSTSGSSQSFIVTTTTTTESSKPSDSYVHAIYAPPMPSRPVQPLSTSSVTNPSVLFSERKNIGCGLFTQLTVFKALLFTALVILLPPLTVAAAFSSLAG